MGSGARSLGGALKLGQPVVFTRESIHEGPMVVCEPGREKEALELLDKMGLVKLVRPDDGRRPDGTLKPFAEKEERGG